MSGLGRSLLALPALCCFRGTSDGSCSSAPGGNQCWPCWHWTKGLFRFLKVSQMERATRAILALTLSLMTIKMVPFTRTSCFLGGV